MQTDIKELFIGKFSLELKSNEENIKAIISMIEINKAKIDFGDWAENQFDINSQIVFLEERLLEYTKKRKELLNNIKNLEELRND